MDKQSQAFLDEYLCTLSAIDCKKYQSFSAEYFCGDEQNANLCAELIKTGQKTATCCLYHWYESGEEPLPPVGHLQVVLDWSGKPVCIIEYSSVEMSKFKDVSAEFAWAEGEGDRSLESWRKAHWKFFSGEYAELGIEPSEEMMLSLERFRVVYP